MSSVLSSEPFPGTQTWDVGRIIVLAHRSIPQVEESNMISPDGNTATPGTQTTSRIVIGLFTERSEAEDAIRDLKGAGFTNEQIGVATQDRTGGGEDRAELEDRSRPAEDREEELGEIVEDTAKGMAQGAAVGALGGGVVGGLLGLISSLLIPGAGPVLVGGVLATALMGAGLGAATGGLIGALIGMGVPERDARYFDQGLREGGTLVTVNAGDGTPEALAILQRHGGDLGPSGAERFERESGLAASQADRSDRTSPYEGEDRRSRKGESYSGPERRLAGV
jgi:hypothetical protein